MIGRLANAWSVAGKSRATFLNFVRKAGYEVKKTTVKRWADRASEFKSAISEEKLSGAKRILDEDNTRLLVGHILYQNEQNQVVNAASLQIFCKEMLGIKDISQQTLRNNYKEQGFSIKLMQTKANGFYISSPKLCAIALDWLNLHGNDLTCLSPNMLCSIDITYTSHRNRRVHTVSLKGGKQPRGAVSASKFTNCIVTCGVWYDGVNRTPPVLFTFNSKFSCDTKKKVELARLQQLQRQYKIDSNEKILCTVAKALRLLESLIVMLHFIIWKI